MKIYTRTGDKGTTSLYDATRVPKDDIRVEAYGTIDELNAFIGLAKNYTPEEVLPILERIQRELFNVAGELATVDGKKFPERVTQESITFLEHTIDTYLEKMGKDQPFKFILPGSCPSSAYLHVARTVCRRAERRIITLASTAEIRSEIIQYVNRLADCLYAIGRYSEEKLTFVDFIQTKP